MKKKRRIVFLIISVMLFSALTPGCAENTSSTASINETAVQQTLSDNGLKPIYADDLNDGTYDITVDSSSSMFSIEECHLTVKDGKMTAEMIMSGKGYLYIFMGIGKDALNEDEFISFEENENGQHTFTVDVEALNVITDCSAFSKKKEKWYDRTLIFRSDKLPAEAFNGNVIADAESLGLADGKYTADIKLEGGSGRTTIQSPADIKIENGKIYAQIIWSSSSYEYMIVDDKYFYPVNTEGNSTFEIPLSGFDCNISVLASTTAMSTPYEIEYTLYISSESIKS